MAGVEAEVAVAEVVAAVADGRPEGVAQAGRTVLTESVLKISPRQNQNEKLCGASNVNGTTALRKNSFAQTNSNQNRGF